MGHVHRQSPSSCVLLVEDDVALADQVSRALGEAGISSMVVTTPQDALDTVRSGEQPDAIIVDLLLPRIETFVVARMLRARCAVPTLVVLSGTEPFQSAHHTSPQMLIMRRPLAIDRLVEHVRLFACPR